LPLLLVNVKAYKTVEKVLSGLAGRPGQTLHRKGQTPIYGAPLSQTGKRQQSLKCCCFPCESAPETGAGQRTRYQPFSKQELKATSLQSAGHCLTYPLRTCSCFHYMLNSHCNPCLKKNMEY